MKMVLSWVLASSLGASALSAVTLTWSGATDGNLGIAGNWVGGNLPTSGDDLVFSEVVTTKAVSLTGPGSTTVGNISFSGSSRPEYTFSGTGSPSIVLNGGLTVDAGGNVTFADSINFSLPDATHTVSVAASTQLTVGGIISGTVGFTKTGAGTLVLSGINTYTAPTEIKEGIVSINNLSSVIGGSSALGAPTNAEDGKIRIGYQGTGATLRYTGSNNVVTDRGIDMAGSTGGATLDASGTGSVTFSSFSISVSGSKALTLTGTSNATNTISAEIKNSIDGATRLVKEGTGTWSLSGANTYSGGTTLAGGRIIADNNAAFGTGGVSMTGGATLNVASGKTVSNALTFSGSSANVLGGTGTFGSAVTTNSTVVLSPGNSIGTLNFSNGLTIGTGSAISFQIYDASGAAGTGYDQINVTGGLLALSATANTITFNIVSVNSGGGNAAALNFDPAQSYSWTFATMASSSNTGTITGFNSNLFNLVPGEFTNSLAGGGFSFSLSNDSRSLLLNFTPVPEPETYVLMGTGLSLLAGAAGRRRRR